MIVAGVGFRKGAGAKQLAALVEDGLARASLTLADLDKLATASWRAAEPCFVQAAALLGVPATAAEQAAMQAQAEGVQTNSEHIKSLYGVGSVAEAAALACAGEGAALILPRIVAGDVTCAIARSPAP